MKRKPTDIIFKLEHQFTLYLQRCGVTREMLPEDQLREMRRAFYGGLGQMFFLMTQDVMEMGEKNSVTVLDSLMAQIGEFWESQNVIEIQLLDADAPVGCSDCNWTGKIRELVKPAESGGICQCPKCQSQNIRY